MGQTKNKYVPKGSPAKAIKRVIIQNNDYVCGMCRSIHKDHGTAQSCLMRCYVEWMQYLEVKQFKRGKEDIYQCPVCSRHNLKKNIAIRCLKDCKQIAWSQFQLEASLLNVEGGLPETPDRTEKAHLVALKIDRRRHRTISEQELLKFAKSAGKVESRKNILKKQKSALDKQRSKPIPKPSITATEDEF
jgi:hypothetical protein